MSWVQFIFDGILGDVFDDRCPTRHLIRVLGDALFTLHLALLLSVALKCRNYIRFEIILS